MCKGTFREVQPLPHICSVAGSPDMNPEKSLEGYEVLHPSHIFVRESSSKSNRRWGAVRLWTSWLHKHLKGVHTVPLACAALMRKGKYREHPQWLKRTSRTRRQHQTAIDTAIEKQQNGHKVGWTKGTLQISWCNRSNYSQSDHKFTPKYKSSRVGGVLWAWFLTRKECWRAVAALAALAMPSPLLSGCLESQAAPPERSWRT